MNADEILARQVEDALVPAPVRHFLVAPPWAPQLNRSVEAVQLCGVPSTLDIPNDWVLSGWQSMSPDNTYPARICIDCALSLKRRAPRWPAK